MSEIGFSRMMGGWLSRYSLTCCLSGEVETIRGSARGRFVSTSSSRWRLASTVASFSVSKYPIVMFLWWRLRNFPFCRFLVGWSGWAGQNMALLLLCAYTHSPLYTIFPIALKKAVLLRPLGPMAVFCGYCPDLAWTKRRMDSVNPVTTLHQGVRDQSTSTLSGVGDILYDQPLVVVGPLPIDIPPAFFCLWECGAEIAAKCGFSS